VDRTVTTLEQRVRRLEDRAALDDLVARYFLAADGDDIAGVEACFTPDASFATSGVTDAAGRQDIGAFIAAARGHMGLTLHTPNYALYTFHDDDNAAGLIGAHLEMVIGGVSLYGAVRYQDAYARTGEGWRIARRDMRTVFIAPWGDVGAALLSDRPVRWPGAAPLQSDFPRKAKAAS
jgi:hypothetical protein